MKPRIALLAALFTAVLAAQPDARRIVFTGTGAEQGFALKDLAPELVTDWTPYRFLVLELRLSSPQRFDFRVHDARGARSVRLSPVTGAWVRSAIPLAFLTQTSRQGMDLASVFNKPRAMMWINLSGTPGPLEAVREIGFALPSPVVRQCSKFERFVWRRKIPEMHCSNRSRWSMNSASGSPRVGLARRRTSIS